MGQAGGCRLEEIDELPCIRFEMILPIGYLYQSVSSLSLISYRRDSPKHAASNTRYETMVVLPRPSSPAILRVESEFDATFDNKRAAENQEDE